MIFTRWTFTEIWFQLESNESLGILDTDYIEDYYGTDGQLTLKNSTTGTEYTVLMNPSSNSVSGNILIGYYLLNQLPNGFYKLQGRVRDTAGNYTILSDYIVPNLPQTVQYIIEIANSLTYSSEELNGLTIRGGLTFEIPLQTLPTNLTVGMHSNNGFNVGIMSDIEMFSHLHKDSAFYAHLKIQAVEV